MAILQPALPPSSAPELEDQYETLLNQVWDSERREQLMDRVDQAIRADEEREKRRRKAE